MSSGEEQMQMTNPTDDLFGDGVSREDFRKSCELFGILLGEAGRNDHMACFEYFFKENFSPFLTLDIGILIHKFLQRSKSLKNKTCSPEDGIDRWLCQVTDQCIQRIRDNPKTQARGDSVDIDRKFLKRVYHVSELLGGWIVWEDNAATAKGHFGGALAPDPSTTNIPPPNSAANNGAVARNTAHEESPPAWATQVVGGGQTPLGRPAVVASQKRTPQGNPKVQQTEKPQTLAEKSQTINI